MMRHFIVALALLCAVSTPVFAASPLVINEFIAENDGGLRDVDGDTPDWIEIYNQSSAPVNLAGWALTDTRTNLAKWVFPDTTLNGGAFLVVFASGKNRAVSGEELHLNFQLANSGEYLALVNADGVVAHEYSPQYGEQRANVSYGIGRLTQPRQVLLGTNAAGKVFVPTDDSLASGWTAREFDDSSWLAGNSPFGYRSENSGSVVLAIDVEERGQSLVQPDFQGFLIGGSGAVETAPITRSYGDISVTLAGSAGVGYDDRTRGNPVNSGAFTEGSLLRDFVFARDNTGTGGLDITVAGLTPNNSYQLSIWSFDNVSTGNRVSDWSANGVLVRENYAFNGGVLPTSNEQYRITFESTANEQGQIVVAGRRDPTSVGGTGGADFGVFFNALRVSALTASVPTNALGTQMFSNNATAYIRMPFQVGDPAAVSALVLNIKYDDGFVAYINGQKIAERNAPPSPVWNSTATGDHSSVVSEEITFIPPDGLVTSGENVLAIHGLNVSADNDDFHIEAELFSESFTDTGLRFFKPPTPGAANDVGFEGIVADTRFSVDRGFYDAPISVVITSATTDAQIRWTTNGSAPTATAGFIYTGPITVTNTTFLRAAAFLPGLIPSDVDTHSYIFLDQVLRQPNSMAGFPTVWQGSYPGDYGMDPQVALTGKYSETISNDLRSIPTLSIVSEHNGLWNSSTGIYVNATSSGPAWERAASVELIDGSGNTEFAVNSGLEMHGNASRDNGRTPKHSMRLTFSSDYGPTKLDYDWFGGGVDVHDSIVLRSAGFVDGWAGRYADNNLHTSTETGETFRGLRYRPENTLYLRDVWVKESFRDMGWTASRSEYVHLYINGLYWGLYQPSERLNASYFSLHHGGHESLWDVVVGEDNNGPPVLVDGSLAGWQEVLNLASSPITSTAAYQAIADRVDIDNLIDYMILHIFAESEDWPRHNWYVAARRPTNGLPGTKFVTSVWDQELTLDRLVRRNRVAVGNGAGEIYSPARVYAQLRSWPDFRLHFADRVQKHLFNGGALTLSSNQARLLGPAEKIRDALVGESARWGDARKFPTPGNAATGVTFTRDEWWQPELDKTLTNFFPKLTADNIARFKAASLFPLISAPFLNQFGGAVTNGFAVELTHTNSVGTIFYTVDGTDPRVPITGAVSASAAAYSSPIPVNSPLVIKARVLYNTTWSALVEAAFYPPQDLAPLVLTEVMYNPRPSGNYSSDDLEFIELKNIGTNTLNLSGLRFNGITFVFTNGTELLPGGFIVLVRNQAAFSAVYPGVQVNGVYSGRLDNGGESLSLTHALGGRIFSMNYNDDIDWPISPDGYGYSLVQKNPVTQAPDKGTAWRASAEVGGSPGADDPASPYPHIVVNEVLTGSVDPVRDQVELLNLSDAQADIGGWFISDDRLVPGKFRIPEGTVIPPGGHVVFSEVDFNQNADTNNNFSLSSRGESVYLFSGDSTTNVTGYSHGVEMQAADPTVSFGRHVNSAGEESFPAQISNTFGEANSGPKVGPIVISEVYYRVLLGGVYFVELHNVTDSPVELFDAGAPTNTWRISGIGYSFPTNTVIPARGYAVVVAHNPEAFRANYEVPAEALVLGPYSGTLQADGEMLRIEKPAPVDPSGAAWIIVDEVRYNDKAPWPAGAAAPGMSLQKTDTLSFGNDGAHWEAGRPTPGRDIAPLDSDGDGVPDEWEIANGTNAQENDSNSDPDGDTMTNLQEYIAGTNPLSEASKLSARVVVVNGTDVRIEFDAVLDKSYSLLFSETLLEGDWRKLTDFAPQTSNSVNYITLPPPMQGAQGFYRIVTPQWVP